ncbi:MAG TPA: hypothetical protein VMX18_02105 [Candidatus Bipolaricaulota bacterium]|nr:hypothetical protein [Candidatus Bipolaricaulota bacterium]
MKKTPEKIKKFCISFAGAVGSSKTPISNYLSIKLNLPVYNNDAVRSEVTEDLGHFDSKEHIKRRDARLKEIVKSGISFICDASIDREWKNYKKLLTDNGYRWFIISLDLSKDFLSKLYEAKGYDESFTRLGQLIDDHEAFLNEYSADVNLRVSDEKFPKRMNMCYDKINEWLNKL